MPLLLFPDHQHLQLNDLLADFHLRPFIISAIVKPIRGEPIHGRCVWKEVSDRTRKSEPPRRILICGYCHNGTIRLWDTPTPQMRVPECQKCGAKVIGVEINWIGLREVIDKGVAKPGVAKL